MDHTPRAICRLESVHPRDRTVKSTRHRPSTRPLSILAVVTEPSTTASIKRATLVMATNRALRFVLLKAVATSNVVNVVTSDLTAAGRVRCNSRVLVLLENTTRPKKSTMAEDMIMTTTTMSAARIGSMVPTTATTMRASISHPTPAPTTAVASLAPPTMLSTNSVKMTAPATVRIVLDTAMITSVAVTKDAMKALADKSMAVEDRSMDVRTTTATVVRNRAMAVRSKAMVVVMRMRWLEASLATMVKDVGTMVVVVKMTMATKVVDGKLLSFRILSWKNCIEQSTLGQNIIMKK